MYSADKPITKSDDDLLGRRIFAKQLAQSILSFGSKENFSIGLYGPWGCGKTSIINMTVEEIDCLSSGLERERRPVIVQFNPWNFSSSEHLINQFFSSLKSALKLPNNEKRLEEVGSALEEYSSVLEYLELVPGLGIVSKLAQLFAKGAGKRLTQTAKNHSANLIEAKAKVIDALRKQNCKIVIVIDDIDRLSNEEIRLIFQLVNSVAGFPNVVYLLSFDKEVVVRALETVQNCIGDKYLEKIIQVPFVIPPVDKSKVCKMLVSKAIEVIDITKHRNFDQNHWTEIVQNCINPFVDNLRDVYRVINAFQFKYGLIGKEVNFADLLALTVLQTLTPEIAIWIERNYFNLAGGTNPYEGVVGIEQQKRREEYLLKFADIYPESPHKMLNAIETLFPKVSKATHFSFKNEIEDDLRRERRLAFTSTYHTYFSLSLESIKLEKALLEYSFFEMNQGELNNFLENLCNEDLITEYLYELRSNIINISEDRVELILCVLWGNENDLIGISSQIESLISSNALSYWCVDLLLSKISCSARRRVLLTTVIHGVNNADRLILISNIVNQIRIINCRIEEGELSADRILLSVDDYKIIVENFTVRVKEIGQETCYFDNPEYLIITSLWELLDSVEYKTYLNAQLQAPINQLKYVACSARQWTGSGVSFEYIEERYNSFITSDEVLRIISEYRDSGIFFSLPFVLQQRLAAFVLWLKREDVSFDGRISSKAANTLLEQWQLNLPLQV